MLVTSSFIRTRHKCGIIFCCCARSFYAGLNIFDVPDIFNNSRFIVRTAVVNKLIEKMKTHEIVFDGNWSLLCIISTV